MGVAETVSPRWSKGTPFAAMGRRAARVLPALAVMASAAMVLASPSEATAASTVVYHPCSSLVQVPVRSTFRVPRPDRSPVDRLTIVHAVGGGSFLNSVTHRPFVPRGADYVRKTTVSIGKTDTVCMQSNFDDGRGLNAYNPHNVAQALSEMHAYGYNVIHVGLNSLEIGSAHGHGLNRRYIANLASFINIARSDDIRVMIALVSLPASGGYLPKDSAFFDHNSPEYHSNNLYYMNAEWINAQKRYIHDLVADLRQAHANVSDLFALELVGEQVFYGNEWPLDQDAGTVTTAAGPHAYDMASSASRDAMLDANSLNWQNQLTGAVHRALPSAFVTVGYFAPYDTELDPADVNRVIRPEVAFSSSSKIDFVDLHMYPVFGPLDAQLASLGVLAQDTTKPVILGEFGQYFQHAATPAIAAQQLVAWQQQSCSTDGFHLSGWITWTWDTTTAEQAGIYNMVQGDDAIARALAPSTRPDPCS